MEDDSDIDMPKSVKNSHYSGWQKMGSGFNLNNSPDGNNKINNRDEDTGNISN